MTSAPSRELKSLVELARDKSQRSRSILVTAINDLYSDEEQLLSDQDRAIMLDIIRQLIHEVERSVRRTLAEHLATRADAPEDLIATLANDEIEVAHPILVKSDVLKDPELIEIVQHRTMEHQVAIAIRSSISEQLSDALVETDNEKVVTTLLSNQGAAISNSTMNRAYPVETHTHYMLGVHSNGRRRRTLDVVGVGDNRIGTIPTIYKRPRPTTNSGHALSRIEREGHRRRARLAVGRDVDQRRLSRRRGRRPRAQELAPRRRRHPKQIVWPGPGAGKTAGVVGVGVAGPDRACPRGAA